jgi:hypothetical protein
MGRCRVILTADEFLFSILTISDMLKSIPSSAEKLSLTGSEFFHFIAA